MNININSHLLVDCIKCVCHYFLKYYVSLNSLDFSSLLASANNSRLLTLSIKPLSNFFLDLSAISTLQYYYCNIRKSVIPQFRAPLKAQPYMAQF